MSTRHTRSPAGGMRARSFFPSPDWCMSKILCSTRYCLTTCTQYTVAYCANTMTHAPFPNAFEPTHYVKPGLVAPVRSLSFQIWAYADLFATQSRSPHPSLCFKIFHAPLTCMAWSSTMRFCSTLACPLLVLEQYFHFS